ncbi:hypothetical protein LQ954_03445 [Sphingomonas sp. IC-11]|uniref:hypothetical protein n=1 Tax=Sphingomonas sp. IC-11 TaxID=2898528 RepID=UPI001E3F197B|nr:hypothetical protein [Sphingomonas sp. IC-11]MCD2315202.1 hypothetical protein [Sphingomonas sp. IC-11]
MADLLAEPGVFFTALGGYADCFAGAVPIVVALTAAAQIAARKMNSAVKSI